MKNYLLSVGFFAIIPFLLALLQMGFTEQQPEKPSHCPMVYDPVCGEDGKTYSNGCVASQAGVGYTAGPCGATNEY